MGGRLLIKNVDPTGRIFYVLTCHDTIWNDLWIEYPEAENHNYDALVTYVSAALHAGEGDECD